MRHRNLLFALVLPLSTACFDPGNGGTGSASDTDEGSTGASSSSSETSSAESGSTTDAGTSTGPDSTTDSPSTSGDPTLPPAGTETEDDEDIEFVDSFDEDSGQWTFRDDAAAVEEGPGDWVHQAGDLVQRSDISGAETLMPSAGTYAIGGDFDWDAYLVEVSYTADDDGVAGVLCHVTENNDFIRLDLDHETGIVRLVRSEAGVLTTIAESEAFAVPMELEIERTLTLECGATYRGFVDGALIVEAGEGSNAEGGVGMYASSIGDGPSGLRFHVIEVSND